MKAAARPDMHIRRHSEHGPTTDALMRKAIVISDLDGTLLHPATYSFADALPALDLLREHRIPLVLCSSKTRGEIELYRRRLCNTHPFVAENGGGVFIPRGYFPEPLSAGGMEGYQVIALGEPYAEIRRRFAQLRVRTQARVRGFADMSIAEVCALTGLAQEEAALAKKRDFEEPFVFDGEEDLRFLRAIEAAGLSWTQGRIFHLMGHHDKGRAVNILLDLYRRQYGDIISIGLGDSLNDLPLLQAVDIPVLVRHEDGSIDVRVAAPRLVCTQMPGPAGWNEVVLQFLAADSTGYPT